MLSDNVTALGSRDVATVKSRQTDFILLVVVRTMADYEALTRRLFFDNNNVKRFRSFVSMVRVKVGLTVPFGGSTRA